MKKKIMFLALAFAYSFALPVMAQSAAEGEKSGVQGKKPQRASEQASPSAGCIDKNGRFYSMGAVITLKDAFYRCLPVYEERFEARKGAWVELREEKRLIPAEPR